MKYATANWIICSTERMHRCGSVTLIEDDRPMLLGKPPVPPRRLPLGNRSKADSAAKAVALLLSLGLSGHW